MYVSLLMMGFVIGTVAYVFSENLGFVKTSLLDNPLPPVFEQNGKTYVAFPYPPISLTIISSKDCKGILCDLSAAFQEIKKKVSPAIIPSVLDKDSTVAQELIDKYQIVSLPAFLFDKNLEFVPHFLQIASFFELKEDRYLMKTTPVENLDLKTNAPETSSEETTKAPNGEAENNVDNNNETE